MKAQITEACLKKQALAAQRAEIWDTLVPNFFVQCRESGNASFYLRYQAADGARRTLLLGDAAILTVSEARGLARRKQAEVLLGADPASDAAARQACPSLAALVASHYLPHVRTIKRSWQTDDTFLRCHILPALGHKKLYSISRNDISQLMHRMRNGGKGGTPKGKGHIKHPTGTGYAPATCNRVAILLGYLYNLAMDLWHIPGVTENPARKMTLFEENNARQVFLTPQEIQTLCEAAQSSCSAHNPHTLAIILLQVFTGVRRGNALTACWREFDEARGLWNLPAEKTKSGKPQAILLPAEILHLLKTLASRQSSDYLFPNPRTGKPYGSLYHAWNRLRSTIGMPQLRMHDLRHTFASLLINAGASLYSVQQSLGHSDPKTTMRYAHLADSTQRQLIQSAVGQVGKRLSAETLGGLPR